MYFRVISHLISYQNVWHYGLYINQSIKKVSVLSADVYQY